MTVEKKVGITDVGAYIVELNVLLELDRDNRLIFTQDEIHSEGFFED